MLIKSMTAPQLENNIHSEENPFPAHEEHPGHCYDKAATFTLHRSNVWSYLRSLETRLQVGLASDGELPSAHARPSDLPHEPFLERRRSIRTE